MANDLGITTATHSVTGVNAGATGSTLLGTTSNNGLSFHPSSLRVKVAAASGVIGAASISIGTNATAYDDIMSITALTGLTVAGKFLVLPVALTAQSAIAPNTQVYVKVTTAITGTSETLDIKLIGDYA